MDQSNYLNNILRSQDNLSAFHKGQILTEGLILVREDICDWINKLFHEKVISGDSFLSSLHSGVLLCDLLHRIYNHISSSNFPLRWPKVPPSPDRKAMVGSFKAKDNISLFLDWCRSIGLSNTILFETKGLTNSDEEKNVVLALLHISELCVDFNMPVSEFAKFHKEMMMSKLQMKHTNSVYALGETSDLGSMDSESISARSESNIFDTFDFESSCNLHPNSEKSEATKSPNNKTKGKRKKLTTGRDCPDGGNTNKTLEILGSSTKGPPYQTKSMKFVKNTMRSIKDGGKPDKNRYQNLMRSKSKDDIIKLQKEDPPCNGKCENVDLKIKEINNRCQCQTKFVIERTTLQEGMYKIGTKNIFVRMFRGNIMLRVGGGWETLNEYLNKVDPCCKGNNQIGNGYQRRQSIGSTLVTDLTTEGFHSKNLRKLSQCELTSVKKKLGILNNSTSCK